MRKELSEDAEKNSGGVAELSPRPALAASVLFSNHPIRGSRCEYFTGPASSEEFGWRTMPMLLRRVADWMDSVDLQDPEFDHLTAKTTFSEDDTFYQTLMVYYRNMDKEKTLR